ncbi:3-deoxy-7-phosphoheptulonate synthase [Chloroflexota bacterium]
MIIMESDATQEQIATVLDEVKKAGLKADVSRRTFSTVIRLVGDENKADFSYLATLPRVKKAITTDAPYKLINREYNEHYNTENQNFTVTAGNIEIGKDEPIFMAGPCAIESKKQLFQIAEGVKKAGAHILRGGIFKPRSSVHSFQGLGSSSKEEAKEALSWLCEAGNMFEMPVVTEIRGESQVDLVAEYVDILQIGARNMYDQDLLTKAASKGKPILYKRHFGAGIEEFLSFSEYIAAEGNNDIILCERGLLPVGKGRSYTRYMLDLGSVPAIKKETYLPIMVDPSHAAGRRDLIFNLSCAAIAVGACGLMIEVHYNPAEAIVDGQQMITPDELKNTIDTCKQIHKVIRNKN